MVNRKEVNDSEYLGCSLRKQNVNLNFLNKLSLADFLAEKECLWLQLETLNHWLDCFLEITTSQVKTISDTVLNVPELLRLFQINLDQQRNNPDW